MVNSKSRSELTTILPILSIRTALKFDMECSAAKLGYSTTLQILGDFFSGRLNAQPNCILLIMFEDCATQWLISEPSLHICQQVSHPLTLVFIRVGGVSSDTLAALRWII
ncbi:unnamed protein product [Dibothriocephalus latus]|uniref:Uncharacterized protein n=1 Tax=Dibothriocephalus latus TaxID=60516 RepID=A0A3P7LQI8_DIBLA|nr:unnamed protein product [Dibothriocephalus latus]